MFQFIIFLPQNTNTHEHIEAKTKWPPSHRRYFQIHFLEWKLLDFKWYFIEMCSLWSNWQNVTISSDNGLVLNRRQAIIWTNEDLVYWRIYASLGLSELTHRDKFTVIMIQVIQESDSLILFAK